MKCDDMLIFLETGNLRQRMQARRHAAQCPGCAADLAAWADVRMKLAAPDPLSPRERQLWARAASDIAPARSWHWVALPIGAALAVAACIVLLISHLPAPRSPRIAIPQPKVASSITIRVIDPAIELSRLDADARQLDTRIEQLRQRAQRIEARREVALTVERFSRW
jgi:hypothetical protein